MSVMTEAKFPPADQVHTARIDVDDGVFRRKLLSAMPNVELLELESHRIDHWFVDVPNAGHRLRSLHLLGCDSCISLANLLDLLDRAPLLEELKVTRISITRFVGTLRVVTHPLLSTFHLSHVTKEENDAVFGHLTLPALRSLSFGGDHHSWPRPDNLSFIERSGCMLTELAFCRCSVDEQRLMALLTAQNKITTIQLNFSADGERGRAVSPRLLSFLSTKAEGPSGCPLPALTVLRGPYFHLS
ncbi:hypothetical protein CPB85DRAFT_1341147 [Mucidula mucida]|nr:hypothetical protein CPB85DRAFT_1341147 [Mucidula mucida]